MTYSVHQLAKLAGISVRTLHYYDQIGLLPPAFIKNNGYRCYNQQQVEKLQHILFFKELDFPLEEIKKLLSDPEYDHLKAMTDQLKLLTMKRNRLTDLTTALKNKIKQLEKGVMTTTNEITFRAFDQTQIDEYKEEAKRRWGHTKAYKQSAARTKHWTKSDYKRVAEEGVAFAKLMADTMDKGYASPEFQALVEKHHAGIEVFYDCPIDFYRNLGQMYVDDPRFTAYYDKHREGLAAFLNKAISYYCDHKEKQTA